MVKNDYRRSLIMLRPHAQGYSGHVRLERRTLMGSMYFVISAPATGGTLCATLVRRAPNGTYAAAKLGELRRDGRGQATLAYSFDPRNIDGHALEDYSLIAIVHRTADGCDVVLSGNVNGSHEANWSDVRAAACGVCAVPGAPASDLREPEAETVPEAPLEFEFTTPEPETTPEPGPLPELEISPEFEAGPELDSAGEPLACPWVPEASVQSEPAMAGAQTAGEALGIDMTAPWPGVSEQVREMFKTQPAKELMLGDGYTYVTAPMPEGSGYPSVEIGVRAEDGVPVSVAYALPARFAPEPPPGLEDYVWQGGASEGWWTVKTDAFSGGILL